MSQGYEANHSGRFLESIVEREFVARSFLLRGADADGGNLDIFASRILIRNVPYASLYGCESRSEFLVIDRRRHVRVECSWQETPGSVDEKFPYLLRNAVECMPENGVLILLSGNGARPEAVRWLVREAGKVNSKAIFVLNVNEFTGWVRREFVRVEGLDFEPVAPNALTGGVDRRRQRQTTSSRRSRAE